MSPMFIIGITQGLIAGFFFLFVKKDRPSSTIAGIFMSVLAILQAVISTSIDMNHRFAMIRALRHSLPFTFGPLLYLYTKSVIGMLRSFRKREVLHVTPFVIVMLSIGFGMTVRTPGEPPPMPPLLPEFAGFSPAPEIRWIVIFASANLSYFVYTTLIFTLLREHRKTIGEYFSNESSDITLQWLKALSILFLCINVTTGLLILLYPENGASPVLNPSIAISYGLTFFVFIFALFSGKQSLIFDRGEMDEPEAIDHRKYAKSGLSPDDVKRYAQTLENYMEAGRPYLNTGLTIVDISESLDLKRHHVSQILNDGLNTSFNTYINNHRIDYVIQRMKSGTGNEASLLELAMEAGFNSKSTFNRLFKLRTGVTPSSYRKELSGENTPHTVELNVPSHRLTRRL